MPTIQTLTITLFNLTHYHSYPSNYRAALISLHGSLKGHELAGHLDGSTPCLAQTITTANRSEINPAYHLWIRQDRLIHQAMMASVDTTIVSTVASATNAKRAWSLLHTTYANKSHTRIYSLRDQLSCIVKDNNSISEYLHQIRTIVDELATAGSPVFEAELTIKILNGLGPDFS